MPVLVGAHPLQSVRPHSSQACGKSDPDGLCKQAWHGGHAWPAGCITTWTMVCMLGMDSVWWVGCRGDGLCDRQDASAAFLSRCPGPCWERTLKGVRPCLAGGADPVRYSPGSPRAPSLILVGQKMNHDDVLLRGGLGRTRAARGAIWQKRRHHLLSTMQAVTGWI